MFGDVKRHVARLRLFRELTIYGLKFFNIGAALLVTLLLARVGGASVLGSYALAIQTAQLLTIVALCGMDQVLIRDVASRLLTNEHAQASAHVRAHLRFVAPVALVTAAFLLIAILAFTELSRQGAQDQTFAAAWGFLVVNIVYNLALALMRGLGKQVRVQIFEGLHSWPLAISLSLALLAGWQANSTEAVVLAALCLAGTVSIMVPVLLREVRDWGPPSSEPVISGFGVGLPFMAAWLLSAFSAWFPLFLVGFDGSAADAGRLRAVFQLAMPIMVVLTTTSNLSAPDFAGQFRAGRFDLVRARFRRGTLWTTVLCLPLALTVLIWPAAVLSVVFGPSFVAGADILRVIIAGQVVVMLLGPSGAIVGMAGRQQLALVCTAASVLLMLILSAVLLPRLGVVGIALAFAIGEAGRALLMRIIAERLMRSTA